MKNEQTNYFNKEYKVSKKNIDKKEKQPKEEQSLNNKNIYNKNKGTLKNKNKSPLFIIGISCSLISFLLLISIIRNCYQIIKYDKVTADIIRFVDTSHYDIERDERIYDKYTEITYTYDNQSYYSTIRTIQPLHQKIWKKKTIYVNPENPNDYTYFSLDNFMLFLIISPISYILLHTQTKHQKKNLI